VANHSVLEEALLVLHELLEGSTETGTWPSAIATKLGQPPEYGRNFAQALLMRCWARRQRTTGGRPAGGDGEPLIALTEQGARHAKDLLRRG
jgi:hypothetical protein